MVLVCKDCSTPCHKLWFSRCMDCYEEALHTLGELFLIVEKINNPTEQYEMEGYGTVYGYFYRLEPINDIYLVKTEERRWCLRMDYVEGYPCPAKLAFVNPYNHKDDNPVWWPKTAFPIDPVEQKFDLAYLHKKSSMRSDMERGDLDSLKPISELEYYKQSSTKKTYAEYLKDFEEKMRCLRDGSNFEVNHVLDRWSPDHYVSAIADKILP